MKHRRTALLLRKHAHIGPLSWIENGYVNPLISVTYIWIAFVATATDRIWLKFISALLASAIPVVQLCYKPYINAKLRREK